MTNSTSFMHTQGNERSTAPVRSSPLIFRVSKTERILPSPTVIGANGSGVITNPDTGVTILVPAAAGLKLGERVQGVIGTFVTDAVDVSKPDEALPIPVSALLLWRVDGTGQLPWHYEVEINGQWQRSNEILITVASNIPITETFETIPDQAILSGQTVVCPALTLVAESVSDTHITRVYAPIPPFPLAAPWIYHQIGVLNFNFKRHGNTIEFDVYEHQNREYILQLYDNNTLVDSITKRFATGIVDKFSYTSLDRLINRLRLDRKVGQTGSPAQFDNFGCFFR
ncbi:hypothetical protein [Pseudomonas sp. PSKL.D1]|uniref:hypothetical protein n=1 Tax=Pseudomonas sp. PSKL.D1 TaxID=3029060 RepID=UPI0023816083|nr:hypothetical protein [Pseudomonas sp. PSKL.D1]WDY60154.1 hypothetical protein PVV54_11190 [Pseudomonas sp. PSKL.D1]